MRRFQWRLCLAAGFALSAIAGLSSCGKHPPEETAIQRLSYRVQVGSCDTGVQGDFSSLGDLCNALKDDFRNGGTCTRPGRQQLFDDYHCVGIFS